jgi:hypothetical protein
MGMRKFTSTSTIEFRKGNSIGENSSRTGDDPFCFLLSPSKFHRIVHFQTL